MTLFKFALYASVAMAAAGAAWWFYDAGGDAVRVDHLNRTLETQRRIDDADAHGPRTPDDVDQRLRDGKF
jgi:hypothetical protein